MFQENVNEEERPDTPEMRSPRSQITTSRISQVDLKNSTRIAKFQMTVSNEDEHHEGIE